MLLVFIEIMIALQIFYFLLFFYMRNTMKTGVALALSLASVVTAFAATTEPTNPTTDTTTTATAPQNQIAGQQSRRGMKRRQTPTGRNSDSTVPTSVSTPSENTQNTQNTPPRDTKPADGSTMIPSTREDKDENDHDTIERATEKAKRDAEKIQNATERATEQAKREEERKAEKTKREEERATEKAKREEERKSEKAQNDAEHAAEKAQRDANVGIAQTAPSQGQPSAPQATKPIDGAAVESANQSERVKRKAARRAERAAQKAQRPQPSNNGGVIQPPPATPATSTAEQAPVVAPQK
jgi:hypothetical protein